MLSIISIASCTSTDAESNKSQQPPIKRAHAAKMRSTADNVTENHSMPGSSPQMSTKFRYNLTCNVLH